MEYDGTKKKLSSEAQKEKIAPYCTKRCNASHRFVISGRKKGEKNDTKEYHGNNKRVENCSPCDSFFDRNYDLISPDERLIGDRLDFLLGHLERGADTLRVAGGTGALYGNEDTNAAVGILFHYPFPADVVLAIVHKFCGKKRNAAPSYYRRGKLSIKRMCPFYPIS